MFLHSKDYCYTKRGTKNGCCPKKIPQIMSLEMDSRTVIELLLECKKICQHISAVVNFRHAEGILNMEG